jgi:hypothetical protein
MTATVDQPGRSCAAVAAPEVGNVEPHFAIGGVTLHHGRCEDVLPLLAAESIDAVVTDPPAGIAFMGREWDRDKGGRDQWIAWLTGVMEEACRVLKPGGHALVWALPRTSHWTAMALEDAGFEIRDCIVHLFGSGFPKSLDVAKAIDHQRDDRPPILKVTAWLAAARDAAGWSNRQIDDLFGFDGMAGHWTTQGVCAAVPTCDQWSRLKEAIGFSGEMDAEVRRLNQRKGTPGHERKDRLTTPKGRNRVLQPIQEVVNPGAPVLDAARQWEGWGTALKPGQEHWWLCRKPLAGTGVAANVLAYGTGALNIDGCRVGSEHRINAPAGNKPGGAALHMSVNGMPQDVDAREAVGRWPANLVSTHSASCVEEGPCAAGCPVGELDRQSGNRSSGGRSWAEGDRNTDAWRRAEGRADIATRASAYQRSGDAGGASRYFPTFRYEAKAPASERPKLADGTAHPTVKPLSLMRFLARLVTPPGGLVLDPFAGSGTTGEACVIEGFRCVLIEQDEKHVELIKARLSKPIQPDLFG